MAERQQHNLSDFAWRIPNRRLRRDRARSVADAGTRLLIYDLQLLI